MRPFALPRSDWLAIAGGAVLLFLAYPPFHLLLPSFLCLVPAVRLVADAAAAQRPARRLLLTGFWFGAAAHGLVLYWMAVGLWHFTWTIVWGYLASVAVLGLYTAGVFALSGWIMRRTPVPLALAFPTLWTAMDWLVGHQGDVRFPWLGLGTSLTGYPTLVQLADVVGARGITFLLVTANAALALAWLHARQRRRAAALVGSVVLGVALAAAYGAWRERSLERRSLGVVAVIQPNIGFDEKWNSLRGEPVFRKTLAQAESALAMMGPDLVVWPEAAVPDTWIRRPDWRLAIARLSRRYARPQLVGAIDLAPRPEGERYDVFNAAFLFDSLGRSEPYPAYHKRYLVPITENVPFFPSDWFDLKFFGSFAPGGPGPVFAVGMGRFGVLICYESIFENLSRDYRRRGADFLVNITNDAWFGRTTATHQHAAHLTMRAIENRVGIARAANTGISGFVDPLGRQHQRTGVYVEAVAARTLVTTDVLTLYTRWGDWVGLLSLLAAVGFTAWAWRRSREGAGAGGFR